MKTQSVFDKIETYLIVTLIAVLVWLFAEDRNVSNHPREPIWVKFVAPSEQQLAIDRPLQRVHVTFRGSDGQMSVLRKQMKNTEPIRIELADNPSEGLSTRTIVLKDELAQTDLEGLGLTVIETDPVTMNIRVERLLEAQLPIKVVVGDIELAPGTTIEPKEAKVQLPASLMNVVQDPNVEVLAQLDPRDLEGLAENVMHQIDVDLALPNTLLYRADQFQKDWLKLLEPTAQATFTILKQKDTYKIPSVPIRLSIPPSAFDRYTFKLSGDAGFLHDLEVFGPRDVIDQIRGGELKVWTELWLTNEALEKNEDSFIPIIRAPPGVDFDPPQQAIRIEVTPIE